MRRRVSPGLVLGVVAGLAAPAVALGAHGVRLNYYDDPRTTIAVSWNGDDAADSQIQYGTSPGALDHSATATSTPQAAPLNFAFTARLSALTAGTTYYYRVGGAAGAFYPGGAPFSFTTRAADPCAPLRFVLIGDNRADLDGAFGNPLWAMILAEAMAHAPDLFVNTGDMVRTGSREDEWGPFIDDSEAGWALVPTLLTMGNHDSDSVTGDGALYNQLYEQPRNGMTGTEDYYSIDVGSIHFVSLSTQFTSPGSAEYADMIAWVSADLAATTQTWKIVFLHKPPYSRGNHSSGEENNGAINLGLVPVFDANHVDLVFSGHSHDYERYAPSVGVDTTFGGSGRRFPAGPGGSLPSAVPDGTVGTTYMVSGGAGALTTDVFGFTCIDAACTNCLPFGNSCPTEVYDNDVNGTVVYDGRHNFAVFDVDGAALSVQVWSTAAGNVTGARMLDSFTMTSAESCAPPMPEPGNEPGPDAADVPGVDDVSGTDAGMDGGGPGGPSRTGGCSCGVARAAGPSGGALLLGLAVLGALGWRSSRRRRHR